MINRIHTSKVTEQWREFITKRMNGEIPTISTGWDKLDKATGGLELNTVFTYASPSGGGKTTFMINLGEQIPRSNKGLLVEELCFSLEMLGRNIITRKLSKNCGMTTKYINQTIGEKKMTDSDLERLMKGADYYSKQHIYFVQEATDPITVKEINKAINDHRAYLTTKHGGLDNFILLITLDHTLLITEDKGETEMDMLKKFSQMLNIQKRIGKTIIVVLAQTNGGLDDMERLLDVSRQYPNKSDIYSSKTIYWVSDYIIIGINPYRLGIGTWGRNQVETKGKLFWHLIKQREGEECILIMRNELQFSRIKDYVEKDEK